MGKGEEFVSSSFHETRQNMCGGAGGWSSLSYRCGKICKSNNLFMMMIKHRKAIKLIVLHDEQRSLTCSQLELSLMVQCDSEANFNRS